MQKQISKQLGLSKNVHSKGFSSVGLRSTAEFDIDPFLNLDFFIMSEPTFRPHPHAGFSAVTYLLPESKGAFQNRDSFGDKSKINPGSIHWTQAGHGMMHEEVPLIPGENCTGFQIFVNLSQKHKQLNPKAFHASAETIPEIKNSLSTIRVVAGSYKTLSSPLKGLATPVTLLDVTLESQGSLDLELDPQLRWFLFVISGEGHTTQGHKIADQQAVLLSDSGRDFSIHTSAERFRFLVCGGRPIQEAVIWGGPFCMNSKEEVMLANDRFRAGQMGSLEPSF